MMATRVSEFLFLFLLSILTVCSSGLSPLKDYEQKLQVQGEEDQIFHFSNRVLSSFRYKATRRDLIDPSTRVYPSTPIINHMTTPAVVNVPSTNPVIVTPNPSANTVTVPSATPVSVPITNPVNSPLPVTNPVTTPSTNPGAPPVTNPVTNSTPPGGVPVATPGTTPVAPPATTNAPAIPGQSWCVAKSGSQETALQAALDYACGTSGVDCTAIQPSGSCYNPNSLQNHASYAFNSYYQKNPVQTSCDFGGTAMITNTNPSTGSCIYSASASSLPSPATGNPTPASPTSPVTQNPTPASPTPPTPSSGAGPGVGTPPFVLNSSTPASGGTFPDSSSGFNSSTSKSSTLQPFISCIILVTSIITGKYILNI